MTRPTMTRHSRPRDGTPHPARDSETFVSEGNDSWPKAATAAPVTVLHILRAAPSLPWRLTLSRAQILELNF